MRTKYGRICRVAALGLLSFLMIAMILYRAGVYDISFINRNASSLFADTDDSGGDTLPDDGTDEEPNAEPDETEPFETEPDTPPLPDAELLLNEIKSLSAMTQDGWKVDAYGFDGSSSICRVSYDFGSIAKKYSAIRKKVTTVNFEKDNNGIWKVKETSAIQQIPAVSLYDGLLIINNGKQVNICNPSGKTLVSKFQGTPAYARTGGGDPIVLIGDQYYAVNAKSGMSGTALAEGQIMKKALSFNSPIKYGVNTAIGLFPFSVETERLVEVDASVVESMRQQGGKDDPPDTVADTTASVGTDSTADTDASSDDPSDTTDAETVTGEETDPAETTVMEETQTASDAPVLNDFLAETTSAEDTFAEDVSSDGTLAEDTTAKVTSADSVAEDTTAVQGDLPEGITEMNGKYYTTEKVNLWGYRDKNGKTVIQPQYAMAYDFSGNGLAAVIDEENRMIFINSKGTVVISLTASERIESEQYGGHIRQRFSPAALTDIRSYGMYYFDHGYVMVRYTLNGDYYKKREYESEFRLIDEKGKYFAIPNGYELINYSDGILLLRKGDKYGYMDLMGNFVKPAVYRDAHPFVGGIAVVQNEQGWYGAIDINGNTVIPFAFRTVSDFSDGYVVTYSESRGWELYAVVSK